MTKTPEVNAVDAVEKRRTTKNAGRTESTVKFSISSHGITTHLTCRTENGIVIDPKVWSTRRNKVFTSLAVHDGLTMKETYEFTRRFHQDTVKKFTGAPQKRARRSTLDVVKDFFK